MFVACRPAEVLAGPTTNDITFDEVAFRADGNGAEPLELDFEDPWGSLAPSIRSDPLISAAIEFVSQRWADAVLELGSGLLVSI